MTQTQIVREWGVPALRIERTFDAPVGLVWRGWTDPEILRQWWGPHDWTTTIHRFEPRPGGAWVYSMRPDGLLAAGESDPTVWGRVDFIDVETERRLRFRDMETDGAGRPRAGSEMDVEVDFVEESRRTRVGIRTLFESRQRLEAAEMHGMVQGYVETLDRLAQQLQAGEQS